MTSGTWILAYVVILTAFGTGGAIRGQPSSVAQTLETTCMGNSNPAIEALLNAWKDAIASGDLEAIAELVTEDAEFWSNGQAPLTGRQAVKEAFEPFVARYDMDQEFRCDELVVAEDWAFMRGVEVNRLVSRDTGDETAVRQRAFSIMRRGADGKWRFSRGMTNRPPEAP